MTNNGRSEGKLTLGLCVAGVAGSILAITLILTLRPAVGPFSLMIRILAGIALWAFILGTMLSIEAIHKSNLKFALTAFGAWTLGIFFLTWPLRDIISPTQRQAWIIAIPAALVCVASLVVAFAGLRHSRSHAYKLQEHLEVLKCLEATLDERIRDFELQDKISTAATDTIPAHDSSPNAP